jgi:hypothetical protein
MLPYLDNLLVVIVIVVVVLHVADDLVIQTTQLEGICRAQTRQKQRCQARFG